MTKRTTHVRITKKTHEILKELQAKERKAMDDIIREAIRDKPQRKDEGWGMGRWRI